MEEKIVENKKEGSSFSWSLSLSHLLQLSHLSIYLVCLRSTTPLWFTDTIVVHYYGTHSNNLQLATFYPGCHLQTQKHIRLSFTQTEHHIRYTAGVIELAAINSLLVARNLTSTSAWRFTSKSRRLLMLVRDELFVFE